MQVIRDNAKDIVERYGLPQICQIKGCYNPIFAVVLFKKNEVKGTKVLSYPICRKHCIEGSKLGTVIWDFKEI